MWSPVCGGVRPVFLRSLQSSLLRKTVFPSACAAQSSVLTLTTTSKQLSAAGGHDHSKHWTAEKILTIGLIGLAPIAFINPMPATDYLFCLAATVHVHWGVEAIVVDYIRPSIFGATIPKISVAMVYALSAATLGGLFYFNYTDVGLVQAIRMLWKL